MTATESRPARSDDGCGVAPKSLKSIGHGQAPARLDQSLRSVGIHATAAPDGTGPVESLLRDQARALVLIIERARAQGLVVNVGRLRELNRHLEQALGGINDLEFEHEARVLAGLGLPPEQTRELREALDLRRQRRAHAWGLDVIGEEIQRQERYPAATGNRQRWREPAREPDTGLATSAPLPELA